MSHRRFSVSLACTSLLLASLAVAGDDSPQHERHEIMEGVGKAAKVIGGMLRGETEYDAAAAMQSLETFKDASAKFGDLFPEGSDSGEDTKAAPEIWLDRDGFNAALQKWTDAVGGAIETAPATLEEAKPALGPIFQACKNCHDNYRIDDE